MKLVKLSLVAALAAGSFSALNAKPLEEAIKNVDVKGFARYRYDSGTYSKDSLGLNAGGNGVNNVQDHRFKAAVGAKLDVGEGFKVFGQLMYYNDHNYGFQYNGAEFKQTNGTQGANTKQAPRLKQAYLEYENLDYGTKFVLGRQMLNTVWDTGDIPGMAAKAFFTPVNGLTLAAFAVDSIEGSENNNGSYAPTNSTNDGVRFNPYVSEKDAADTVGWDTLNRRLYKYNIYGAAALAEFGGLKAQIWGGYWQNTANLWVLKLDYTLPLAEDLKYNLKINYFGNTLDDYFTKDTLVVKAGDSTSTSGNGQLIDVRGAIKGYGFDAQLGGIMFGKKDKFTINTLEGISGGSGLYIGREIFYQKGSWISLSYGQSTYGYVGAGYTLPANIRIGVQGVYGGTKSDIKDAVKAAGRGTGTKMELVGEASWKVNDNLDFSVWYSRLSTLAKGGKNATDKVDAKSIKDSVRFQAYYKF